MKKILLISLFAFIATTFLKAQPPLDGGDNDKLKAQKVAYITAKLNLTSDEAAKFWPVYNEYDAAMKVIREKRKQEMMSAKMNFDSLTDTQLSSLIDAEFSYQQQELDLKKKYYTVDYKKVLPVKKIALLYRAEMEFNKEVVKLYMQNQQNKGGGPGPGGNKMQNKKP